MSNGRQHPLGRNQLLATRQTRHDLDVAIRQRPAQAHEAAFDLAIVDEPYHIQLPYLVHIIQGDRDGLFLATGETYDAIVLDRLMPQMDGLSMLAALRATGSRVPVLILSALGHVDERIRGLRAGGVDALHSRKLRSFAEVAFQ